ncbi:MAG: hypothetical protein DCC43_01180 [Candidatus Brocadia sp.]|jgi:uncharacterized membrane protein required for colicin V production|nr:hypothetical protein [Candidatus Brocadia fulgida]MCC6324417.1 CvpA family protein [Candidatus Brocadia sp.]MCE7910521.1 CvpA family protein [Candidatus Brocadia sp. AMX3]MDG5996493.1 CvpA family protein [Candidatus Brocadia sp.]RIK03093.1 MAG: hypothetical protein DCC43_01180 [Candidatus Brocadia sp.]
MHWIDYTIFGVLFFAMVMGITSGPLLQLLRIGSLFISFFAALLFYDILSNFLKGIFTVSTAGLLGYLIIFGIACIATYLITDLIKKLIGKGEMGMGARLLGGILGILKGLVFSGVIIHGVLSFCSTTTCDTVHTSKVATHIGKGMQKIIAVIPENISKKIRDYADSIRKGDAQEDSGQDKNKDFKSSL